jgi:hypothetical protein
MSQVFLVVEFGWYEDTVDVGLFFSHVLLWFTRMHEIGLCDAMAHSGLHSLVLLEPSTLGDPKR